MNLPKNILIISLVSFLIETILFYAYYISTSTGIIFISYIVGIIILMINIILVLTIIFSKNKGDIKLKCFGMVLVNISVMVAYGYSVILLTNYIRITLVNSTLNTVTTIQTLGCEEKFIDRLERGATKTVWIRIAQDCSIDIKYIYNGTQRVENVIQYISPSMGGKIKYIIKLS